MSEDAVAAQRPRPLDRADRAVAATSSRLGRALALRAATWGVVGWMGVWGGLVLALRAGLGRAAPHPAWGLSGALAVAAAAAFAGWRQRPAADLVRARLEAMARCGGLVLAAAEADLGGWHERLPAFAMPRLRWRAGRALGALAAAGAFAFAAALVPVASMRNGNALDLSRPAAQIAARLDMLAALDQAPAPEWREELGKATDLAAAGEAERAWQSLDALTESLDEAQRAEADAALAEADRLSRAAAALTSQGSPGAQRPSGDPSTPQAGAGEPPAGAVPALDAAASAALAAQMRRQAGDARKLATALRGGTPVDLATLRQLTGLDEQALADLLAQHGKAGEGSPSQDGYGNGGVDRGRGDAPFMVKEPSHNAGIGFHDQPLPPATLAGLDGSVVLSTDAARPRPGEAVATVGGPLAAATAAGGEAFTELVLPRHRAAVRRYFARSGG